MSDNLLTPLERTVLNEICKQYPKDRASLEAQIASASVTSRENTGAGFFTYFRVASDAAHKVTGEERVRGDVLAKLHGLEFEMGFILFLEDGFLSCLEGYLNGDETTTGLDLVNAAFEITSVAPPVGE
jgi:hypothetical protein